MEISERKAFAAQHGWEVDEIGLTSDKAAPREIRRMAPHGTLSVAEMQDRASAARVAKRTITASKKKLGTLSDPTTAQARAVMKEIADAAIGDLPKKKDLGALAAAVVGDMGRRILSGAIRVDTTKDAAHAAQIFFNIARLEAGESTTSVGQPLTKEERTALIADIREKVNERRGLAVVKDA